MEKTTLHRVLGWEDMNPVQLALANADIHLSYVHGVLLNSADSSLAEDNLKVHQLIDKANYWLEEQGFPCTYRKHVDGNIVRQIR